MRTREKFSLALLCYAARTAEPTLTGRHLKLEKVNERLH